MKVSQIEKLALENVAPSATELLELGAVVAGFGLGTVDYIRDTIKLDERAAALFDLPANVAIARNELHARIHPDDRPDIERELGCLFDLDGSGHIDVKHRIVQSDGNEIWVQARKQVHFLIGADGEHIGLKSGLVAIQDITEHKRDQERVQYLMEELNHRAKNAMGVIQGMVRLAASSDAEKAFADRFSDRLKGLSYNHDALVKSNWEHIDLRGLVEFHLSAFADVSTDRVSIIGNTINLNSHAAQSIGMAMHELATNAVKYGALSNDQGYVTVKWEISSDAKETFKLEWIERDGPPVSQPTRKGFGQNVIERMAAAGVNGTVDLNYETQGLSWTLIAPLGHVKV
ncbi:sensor histidine kinase [Pseudahrensia aquimaris]|uniref:histidine kinase n=1 Tax=Pseudahrensia aquimaris TaxID=744461 RepID=A0ABW3FEF7_9HYPH